MQKDIIKIKITVAGRNYPLKVTPAEEEFVRQAVRFIEKRISEVEKLYNIKDIQDIQAIILVELASELGYLKRKCENEEQEVLEKLEKILNL